MSLPGGRITGVDRARGGDKQKIVNQLAVRRYLPAPGGGLESLNESRGQYFCTSRR